MQLEDYFDFLAPNDIRVQGTRVGIETILSDYLNLGLSPEEISLRYPTLTLEAVYATITYYWHKQTQVDEYLRAWQEHGERMWKAQNENPHPAIVRLRARLKQQALSNNDAVMVA